MMTEAIFILFAGIIILTISFNFKLKKHQVFRHHQKCKILENELEVARFQINFRNDALDSYNFQTYNLNDSLVVQPEINLN